MPAPHRSGATQALTVVARIHPADFNSPFVFLMGATKAREAASFPSPPGAPRFILNSALLI